MPAIKRKRKTPPKKVREPDHRMTIDWPDDIWKRIETRLDILNEGKRYSYEKTNPTAFVRRAVTWLLDRADAQGDMPKPGAGEATG